MIERALSAIRPAASVLVDKNLEIGIPAGLVVLRMALILSIHRLCQLALPQAAGAAAARIAALCEGTTFRELCAQNLRMRYLIREVPRSAAPHRMKRNGAIDDENEELFA